MWKNLKTNIKERLEKQKIDHPIRHTCLKWLFYLFVIIFIMLIILSIVVYIIIPIVFMCCKGLQRFCVFMNIDVPSNPNFKKPQDYGFEGVNNFYITSTVDMGNRDELISLGAWWIPQETYIKSKESMDTILAKNEYPVLLYNHGILATRILSTRLFIYETLRKFFHVVAIDYRDYGDSTRYVLSEDGVVADVVNTYNLMKTKTQQDVYVWGHSLGGGISAHAVKWLKKNQNEMPTGLVIESSFTCLEDEIYEFMIGKFFRWLPWFHSCVVAPLHNNGLIFNTTENVLDVDCPIMIMHAADDNVIPFYLGKKNFEQTVASRKPRQGKVSFHSFPAEKKYGHVGCTKDPAVPGYIKDFMKECNNWKTNLNKTIE